VPQDEKTWRRAQARHHDPDAARPDYAQQIGFCRFQHGVPQCTAQLTGPAEAGDNDYGRARAPLAQFADQRRYSLGRRGDGQIRGSRQACDVRIDVHAIDSVGMPVDQRQFAGKAGAAEVRATTAPTEPGREVARSGLPIAVRTSCRDYEQTLASKDC
jgi:hypothetical protein